MAVAADLLVPYLTPGPGGPPEQYRAQRERAPGDTRQPDTAGRPAAQRERRAGQRPGDQYRHEAHRRLLLVRLGERVAEPRGPLHQLLGRLAGQVDEPGRHGESDHQHEGDGDELARAPQEADGQEQQQQRGADHRKVIQHEMDMGGIDRHISLRCTSPALLHPAERGEVQLNGLYSLAFAATRERRIAPVRRRRPGASPTPERTSPPASPRTAPPRSTR